MASETWLVVGLGNPGPRYSHTRHNAGFEAVERLVLKRSVALKDAPRDEAIWGAYDLEGREVVLFFPQTFMNESGRAVAPFARYRQIPLERILALSDDMDLPVGRLRCRPSGSSGGQHGMDSLIAHLGSPGFPRIRLGIGKPAPGTEGAGHVLSPFAPEEKPLIAKALERAAAGAETYILKGAEAAMREINGDRPEN
ncbi:MAG TPA: aminoacyl-tRNA hydrolase [bacterium]|nr:aminoacyl-tRNA hydrolase [bacterium]